MNRKLIVTLLRKDIQELEMITEGFMEMNIYPKAIILLAQRKTDDIQSYIKQLSELELEESAAGINDLKQSIAVPTTTQATIILAEPIIETSIDTDTTDEIHEEIDASMESTSELIENDDIVDVKEAIEDIVVNEDTEITEIKNTDLVTEEIKENEINKVEIVPETNIKPLVDETRKTILGEKNILTTPSRNEQLLKADNSISSSLANKKIHDIKQAISIGDRFRFQRELFRGNGEDMNKTLTYINLLATLEEALSFIQSKYGWTPDNETAEDFYQIVRRRFL
ncbi:MAG TPA: hypothetical protein VIK55_10190 [Paludibacter sp.]